MTERVLEDRGISYRTNEFERDRPTLVFVHGVSGSSSAWRAYEGRFERHYNLVTYDIRGHGKSRKYNRRADYAIEAFVDDLAALLAHLSIRRCIVVGHSFAVLIVLEFLRLHPDLASGAILLSADFDVGRRRSARLLKLAMAPIAFFERLPLRRAAGRQIDYTPFAGSGDWNLRRLCADIGNTTWRVYLWCLAEALEPHPEWSLEEIHVPVRLVHGRRDTIFSVKNAIRLAAGIPLSDLVLLDTDHTLVLNRPREVGDAIEGYLTRWWPAGRSALSASARTRRRP
jgi:pimeloyl-ACP methyl ester carboxylesterase